MLYILIIFCTLAANTIKNRPGIINGKIMMRKYMLAQIINIRTRGVEKLSAPCTFQMKVHFAIIFRYKLKTSLIGGVGRKFSDFSFINEFLYVAINSSSTHRSTFFRQKLGNLFYCKVLTFAFFKTVKYKRALFCGIRNFFH